MLKVNIQRVRSAQPDRRLNVLFDLFTLVRRRRPDSSGRPRRCGGCGGGEGRTRRHDATGGFRARCTLPRRRLRARRERRRRRTDAPRWRSGVRSRRTRRSTSTDGRRQKMRRSPNVPPAAAPLQGSGALGGDGGDYGGWDRAGGAGPGHGPGDTGNERRRPPTSRVHPGLKPC